LNGRSTADATSLKCRGHAEPVHAIGKEQVDHACEVFRIDVAGGLEGGRRDGETAAEGHNGLSTDKSQGSRLKSQGSSLKVEHPET